LQPIIPKKWSGKPGRIEAADTQHCRIAGVFGGRGMTTQLHPFDTDPLRTRPSDKNGKFIGKIPWRRLKFLYRHTDTLNKADSDHWEAICSPGDGSYPGPAARFTAVIRI
jgi:hypothetical protein